MNTECCVLLLISAVILATCSCSKSSDLDHVERSIYFYTAHVDGPNSIREYIEDYLSMISASRLSPCDKAKKIAGLAYQEMRWDNHEFAAAYLLESLRFCVLDEMIRFSVYLSVYNNNIMDEMRELVLIQEELVFDKESLRIWAPFFKNDSLHLDTENVCFSRLLDFEIKDFRGVWTNEFNSFIKSVIFYCNLNAEQLNELYSYYKDIYRLFYGVVLDRENSRGIIRNLDLGRALRGLMYLCEAAREIDDEELVDDIVVTVTFIRDMPDRGSYLSPSSTRYIARVLGCESVRP